MSEQEKSIVRACLDQVLLGLDEAREVYTWWTLVSEANRQAWKEFVVFAESARAGLSESTEVIRPSMN